MAQDPHEIGTTGPPVTPGPGAIYPTDPSAPITAAMISAIHQEHNLQAMVELQYVRIGSEVMNSALASLDEALTVSQKALDKLANLENLHNQITVSAKSTFPFDFKNTGSQLLTWTGVISTIPNPTATQFSITSPTFTGTISFTVTGNNDTYIEGYQKLASAFYGHPIKPYFHIGAGAIVPGMPSATIISAGQPQYSAFLHALLSSRTGISALIVQLSAITSPGDKTTLLFRLKKVLANIPSAGVATFSTVQAWAIDNYGGSSGPSVTAAGKFQQDITNAITAASSLNTSQNEAVRRYMFVFEQYCQSAAAILTALNQLFDKISRGIAG